MARPLVAEIDLAALRHNYQLALDCSPAGTAVAVIKANAYGHGAIAVAAALADLAPAFAVACIEEADELVAAGIRQPILLLEGFFTADELPRILRHGYEIVLHSGWQLEQLAAFLAGLQVTDAALNIWLKVDTGMHRLGFAVEEAAMVYRRLQTLPAIGKITLTSHLACADDLSSGTTPAQLQRLQALQQELDCPLSLANSPAIMGWPAARQGWLRPGIMLYGASPLGAEQAQSGQLQPVMRLRSELISVRWLPAGEAVGYGARFVTQRPTRIGVVACGYGDGYPRHAREGTPVVVNGVRCRLAGRVSMDMLTVDLSACPDAQVGDEVELWGAELPVNEVAEHCDTISYTLLTGLLPRVPRRYLQVDVQKVTDGRLEQVEAAMPK